MTKNTALLTLISMLMATPVLAASTYRIEAIIFSTPSISSDELLANSDKPNRESPRISRAQNKLDNLYARAVKATEIRKAARLERLESPENAATDAPSPNNSVDTIITSELDTLKKIRDSLAVSPQYEILQTLSWQQLEAGYMQSPLIDTRTPQMKGVIRVYAPNLLFAELNLTYVQNGILPESLRDIDEDTEPGYPGAAQSIPPTLDTRYYSIDGRNNLYVEAATKPVLVRYFIDEQRKLKLDEIHYFDHPKFGVILSVKRVDENNPDA